MRKYKPSIFVERSYEESTIDQYLHTPELGYLYYVEGYASFFRNPNAYHHIEYRIREKVPCPKGKRGCRATWVGFTYGGHNDPHSVHRCKHGEKTQSLVSKIFDL